MLAWGAQHLQGGCPRQQQLSAQFGHLRAVTSLGEVPPSCLQLTSSRPLKCFSSFWSPAACPFSVPKPSPRWDAEPAPPLLPCSTATGNIQHLSPNLWQHLLMISFPNKLP